MDLTNHQQLKLKECIDILKVSDRLLIKGSAGVGKSTLVDFLLNKLTVSNDQLIYCTAPTNKAVIELKNKITTEVEFATLHSVLKMKKSVDYKTGAITFISSYSEKDPPLKNVKYLIVDECSMVGANMLTILEHHASLNNITIIALGDEKQLNPVKEDNSPIFHKHYSTVELTEIVRQKENSPIITLSNDLKTIANKEDCFVNDTGYVYTEDLDRIIDKLANDNTCRYLAYTNEEVNDVNQKVRNYLYNFPNKIEKKELLIFNTPYKEYYTNQEIIINELIIADCVFEYKNKGKETKKITYKCYIVNGSIRVLHESQEQFFRVFLVQLKEKIKKKEISWKDYYDFLDNFADLTYSYATTIHRAQGSTYTTAIINIANVNTNRNIEERKRLLYTAVTRPSKLLILYNV